MTQWHKLFRFGYEYIDDKGRKQVSFFNSDVMGEERQHMFDELCEFASIFGRIPDEKQWKRSVVESSVTIMLNVLETEGEHQMVKGYVVDRRKQKQLYSTILYDSYRDLLIHELSSLLSKVEVTV